MTTQWTLSLLILSATNQQKLTTAFFHQQQMSPTAAVANRNRRSAADVKFCLAARTPSWEAIEGILGNAYTSPVPSSIDSVLDPKTPTYSTERPTLFRERHGWCPYSERVWLTLEIIGIEYDTIRIDNTGGGRPSYFGGTTPQMKWPEDGRIQGESYDLVEALDERYNNNQLRSDDPDVNDCVNQFRNIFPRARPSSRAAYLFQYNGEPLWKSTFEDTLEKTNDLLGQGGEGTGPFFAGSSTVTAADIAWAPFLERYRYQLPCLHQGLQPDDPKVYPNLAKWYDAMEDQVPAYSCRVKGDASSWRKVLSMAGFGNSGTPPQIGNNMQDLAKKEAEKAASCVRQEIWEQYATGADRPYIASSPGAQAANIVTRNRDRIIVDIQKQQQQQRKNTLVQSLPKAEEELDTLLRGLTSVLMQSEPDKWDTSKVENVEMVGSLASFLDERMCVPRDMGAMSAACIKDLAWKLSFS